MSATTETLVVLRILVDDGRPWWEALGMPDPSRWNDGERDPRAHVKIVTEAQVDRKAVAP